MKNYTTHIDEAKKKIVEQLKLQKDHFEEQLKDYDKGLSIFEPVFNEWKKENPKKYAELLDKNKEKKEKFVDGVVKEVREKAKEESKHLTE